MAEYVTKEAAIEAFENGEADVIEDYGDGADFGFGLKNIKSTINAIPAADVAPVVRCKDCVHWDDDPDTYGADYGPKGKCMKSFETMPADDFCSHGERKDGGDD